MLKKLSYRLNHSGQLDLQFITVDTGYARIEYYGCVIEGEFTSVDEKCIMLHFMEKKGGSIKGLLKGSIQDTLSGTLKGFRAHVDQNISLQNQLDYVIAERKIN